MKKIFLVGIIAVIISGNLQPSFCEEYKPLAIKKHNEGVVFYDKKQYSNAIECFLEATQEDPYFVDPYYNLGVLYEYFGEQAKAMAAYKQLLKLDPYNPKAAYRIAELYEKQRNHKVAINYLALVPKNSPVYKEAMVLKRNLSSVVASEKSQPNVFDSCESAYSGILSPSGVVKDTLGNVYVSDYSSNAVTIINDNGKRIFHKGSPLSGPMGLAVDAYNNLYVACYNSGRVVLLGPDGTWQVIIGGLHRPHDLFIDKENNLYITEQGRNKLIKYKLY
jgi:tetratricopeptide (TPR) repeat protein